MAQATTADPWTGSEAEPSPTGEQEEATFTCPHCSVPLTPHHDAVGSLHCYNPQCNGCCFLPPDETSAGQVRGKFEAKPCAMAMQRAASGF